MRPMKDSGGKQCGMRNSQCGIKGKRPMKDSGIEWIGEIPQNFEVIKNHYLITCIKGKNPNDLNNEGIGFPYIGASDLDSNNYLIYTTDSSLPSVDSNDVLILWDGARAGLVGIGKIGKLSSTLVKLQFVEKINSRYFYWYLLGMSSFITSCVNGTTIPHMSRKYIDDICFITFPLPEQQAIADKLDRVCGEIDNVITKTKAVVEEYKKLKQAIITEAVTGEKQCGMRNSQCGIKEKWAVIKLKWIAEFNKKTLDETTDENYEFDYIDIGSVEYGKGIIGTEHLLFKNAPSRARRIVKYGDIIVSTVRTYLKAITQIDRDYIVSTGFAVFTPNEKIDKDFLKYAVLSDGFISKVEANSVGVNYPAINALELVNFKIPLPPLPEQQAIVAYLDAKCGAIDELIAKKQQLITEMENYKKSIIYEYVTGKREVG